MQYIEQTEIEDQLFPTDNILEVPTLREDKSGGMMLEMKKSMANSISMNNSFKGYPMEFTFSHNA